MYVRRNVRRNGEKVSVTFSLVESYRDEDGQVRQRTIRALGKHPTAAEVEEAIEEANMARANVLRKAGDRQKREPGDWHYGKRHIRPERVIEETIAMLEAAASGLSGVDIATLDDDRRGEWGDRIRAALKPIRKFAREVSA